MALYLMPLAEGRPVILDKAVIFFGRHPECDVMLNRSRKVSRKHCCVAQVNHRIVVRDLGSMNGVTVNGQRVRKEAPLAVGDELVIGDVVYVLREGKPPPPKPEGTNGHAGAAAPLVIPPEEQRPPIEYSQEYPIVIDDDEPDEEA